MLFGTNYAGGDPWRWSPVNIEMLLADWIPRKIMALAAELRGLPTVLRSFVAFCHAERSIPMHLTQESLAAVDEYEPMYQKLIERERNPGDSAYELANAVRRAMGFDDDDDFENDLSPLVGPGVLG